MFFACKRVFSGRAKMDENIRHEITSQDISLTTTQETEFVENNSNNNNEYPGQRAEDIPHSDANPNLFKLFAETWNRIK